MIYITKVIFDGSVADVYQTPTWLGCGPDTAKERKFIQNEIDKGCNDYFWTTWCFFPMHKDYIEYPDDICIVQWSE